MEWYEYNVFGAPTIYTGPGNDGIWRTSDDVTSSTSSVDNPYMFTGRRLDDETGLYYYRNRSYDTYTGRFLQTDPIGYLAGLNLYTYVGNNPVNLVDPFGLHIWPGPFGHRPHKHTIGPDSEAGLNTLPAPYGEIIFEEHAKAFVEFILEKIPYVGPVIQFRELIMFILKNIFVPPEPPPATCAT